MNAIILPMVQTQNIEICLYTAMQWLLCGKNTELNQRHAAHSTDIMLERALNTVLLPGVLMECNWLAVKHHLPKANAQKHSQDRQHQDVTSQVWSHCKPLISSSHIRSRYSKIESSLTKWQIANMKTQVEPFREQGLLPHLTYLAVMAHYALKAY